MDNTEEDDTFWDIFSDLREAKMTSGIKDILDDNIGTTNTMGVEWLRENYMSIFEGPQRELYRGCTTFSAFSFLVKLMHVKVLNGRRNKSFDMLLEC